MRVVDSEERATAPRAVVEASPDGARRLARAYWSEVERATAGLVRLRRSRDGSVLRAFGAPLLRFGAPLVDVVDDRVSCRYPIEGGWLAARRGGSITLGQEGHVLVSSISGFHPRLALVPGLYPHVQARIHAAVSRRYFARLVAAAR